MRKLLIGRLPGTMVSRTHVWRPLSVAACALLLLAARGERPAAVGGQLALEISHKARSLQPGEVVALTIEAPQPLTHLRARAFDHDVMVFATEDPAIWQGLVGLDLDLTPGLHTVSVTAGAASGEVVRERHVLEVRPKKFPTRRLTVSEDYVNPPADVLARIQRESTQVSTILASVGVEKLWTGTFVAPVSGAPTSSFGKRSILNGQPRSPHGGTDFQAGTGTPVQAPNRGTVVLSEDLYFSGNTVILDHGLGLFSYLAHLSRTAVAAGETVEAGDTVGFVGATGRVTGPHLHWAVRLRGARVDPLSLMAALSSQSSASLAP